MPSAFISYSHDTLEHKDWVINLATRLRSTGIDAILDMWEVSAGDDLAQFMEQGIMNADNVVMICTENYVQKCNNGVGGVGYEKSLALAPMLKKIDASKIIPIIKQLASTALPSFLTTKKYINFSNNTNFEDCFEELARAILKSPLYEKPELGVSPYIANNFATTGKKSDPIKTTMELLANALENSIGHNNVSFSQLHKASNGVNKPYLNYCLSLLVNEGLIEKNWGVFITISPKGFEYMLIHLKG